jgi:hypothetical protein
MPEQFILNDSLLKIGKIIHEAWIKKGVNCAVAFEIESPELKELVEKCSQERYFKKLNLDQFDIMFISFLWNIVIDEKDDCFDVLRSLQPFYNEPERFLHLEQVIQLINHNIFSLENDVPRRRRRLKNRVNITPKDLINNSIKFQPDFVFIIVEGEKRQIIKGYSSNKELVMDWFNYVALLEEIAPSGLGEYDSGKSDHSSIIQLENQKRLIEKRTKKTKESFPLLEIINKYALNHEETVLLIYTMKENIEFRNPDNQDMLKIISLDYFEMHSNKKYLQPSGILLANGILLPQDKSSAFVDNYSEFKVDKFIMESILNLPVENHKPTHKSKPNYNREFFELVESSHGFDELILPPDFKKTLSNSIHQFSKATQKTLREWGILSKNPESNNEHGLLLLFYGKPGTGKTFAAHAVAKELNKKILTTDISKISSCWVGESEKNVKELFRSYSTFCCHDDNPPILLLNEADQLLSSRIDNPKGSSGVSHNSVQNLFLEAFENFNGILIATTNLKSNLDPAFDRRFHLKFEFPMPDYNELLHLWKLHLPETIPGVTAINIKQLAEMYQLSGGQIKIIVQNACVEAAARAKDLQKLSQQDLFKYCDFEVKRISQKQKIVGF